jgi:cyclohexadieny/prephenate dehydrogenase
MSRLGEKVSIIGFGLIGSSLARVIRRNHLAQSIICGDSSPDVCQKALALGLADAATPDLAAAVTGADLVILAVPVGACGAVMKQIAGSLKEGAVVTDVGSVKQTVIEAVMPHLPPHAHFVPAHPIAGTEHSGPEAGFAELFAGRWCILTPLKDTPPDALGKVTALWDACGAQVEIMEARRHDLVLAITSHLPHLIAFSIVDTAATLEENTKSEVIKYSASGFRDFTRIAASDPVMWRDIFLNNKEAVLEILQHFNEDLTALQDAIRQGDGGLLEEVFTRTRAIRRAIIQTKQAGVSS